MDYKDYYKILGVSKGASQEEIKKKYRKMAAKYHPDRNQDDPDAQKKFTDVGEAYEVLKDPEKRKLYDQVGSDWKHYQKGGAGGQDGFDWSQYAGQQGGRGGSYRVHVDPSFFGGQTGGGEAGSPFSSFFETLFGGGGRFAGGQPGGGQRRYQGQPFGAAGAQGRPGSTRRGRRSSQPSADMEAPVEVSLKDILEGGVKQFMLNGERVKVTIPPGIEGGKRLKLRGKGQVRPDGSRGDLYLKINVVPENGFERKGRELYYDQEVDLYTAVLGGEVNVPTLTGKAKLTLPAGTQPGKRFRLAGQGLPGMNGNTERGDLLVRIQVRIPESLSAEEKKLFEKLASLRNGS